MQVFFVQLMYLVAATLFILGIKRMARIQSARRANAWSAAGMLLAILAVLLEIGALTWWVLVLGLACGGAIGTWLARRVAMTQMPEMVAALNGCGGAASALVGLAFLMMPGSAPGQAVSLVADRGFLMAMMFPLTILVGWVTFSGSAVAYSKLAGKKLVHPLQGARRHQAHVVLAAVALLLALWMMHASGGFGWTVSALLLSAAALVLGWLVVLPIGGADMPVVVSLLNSYSGIAAALSGFVVGNPLLVVAGCLVGSSGVVLSRIMCKAMNRSLGNVLIGGIGDQAAAKEASEYQNVKSASAEEVAILLEGAGSVIVVPGYGLAVSQAQHALRELDNLLSKRGTSVRYAIHPVAGRMPGHMNVLLAEADVPYDKLVEMDAINPDFKNADVAIVVGANDVVNPAAREASGPIAGMPILNVDEARTVVMIKRSLSPGYAGIKNPLFERTNCMLVFQDAKQALQEITSEVKAL
jgi:NAD(P) transhydrogenase subunit beta